MTELLPAQCHDEQHAEHWTTLTSLYPLKLWGLFVKLLHFLICPWALKETHRENCRQKGSASLFIISVVKQAGGGVCVLWAPVNQRTTSIPFVFAPDSWHLHKDVYRSTFDKSSSLLHLHIFDVYFPGNDFQAVSKSLLLNLWISKGFVWLYAQYICVSFQLSIWFCYSYQEAKIFGRIDKLIIIIVPLCLNFIFHILMQNFYMLPKAR